MIHVIIITEIFLIFKHGKGQFSHAVISPLGILYLGLFVILFVFIFMKVSVSDFIQLTKTKKGKAIS